jgi:hypothetical protein
MEIVQLPGRVLMMFEYHHQTRQIFTDGRGHRDDLPPLWMGDSIGWWEGDTLVVETTNFRPETSPARGGSETTRVIERFTKRENGDVLYNFTVEDPTVWTASWTGEYVWRPTDERVFEYACHEGNYALGNIMRGARLLEQEALAARASSGR